VTDTAVGAELIALQIDRSATSPTMSSNPARTMRDSVSRLDDVRDERMGLLGTAATSDLLVREPGCG